MKWAQGKTRGGGWGKEKHCRGGGVKYGKVIKMTKKKKADTTCEAAVCNEAASVKRKKGKSKKGERKKERYRR